jgi:hypothetical protein
MTSESGLRWNPGNEGMRSGERKDEGEKNEGETRTNVTTKSREKRRTRGWGFAMGKREGVGNEETKETMGGGRRKRRGEDEEDEGTKTGGDEERGRREVVRRTGSSPDGPDGCLSLVSFLPIEYSGMDPKVQITTMMRWSGGG